MSFSPSPTKSRGGYAGTPQHLKTLDILGRSKNFAKLSIDDLSLYCELARSKFNCESATDASACFEDKYGWSIESRMHDIEQAWKFIDITVDSDDDDDEQPEVKSNGAAVDSKSHVQPSEIPIIIKAGSLSRPVLICEVDDDDLHFTGDSGAVGRIFCDENSLRLDLKGRQYSGTLTAGPTLMILNLAAPVGQSSGTAAASSVCARAEVITNEFCHLEFEKDLHSSLQGIYTGNEGDNELFEKDSIAGSDYDGEEKKSKNSKKNSAKKQGISDGINPKISTITQRKRKSSTNKTNTSNTKKNSSNSKKKKT